MSCRAELCQNWSGDGDVCPCAIFGLTPTAGSETCLCGHEPWEHHPSMGCTAANCWCNGPAEDGER